MHGNFSHSPPTPDDPDALSPDPTLKDVDPKLKPGEKWKAGEVHNIPKNNMWVVVPALMTTGEFQF